MAMNRCRGVITGASSLFSMVWGEGTGDSGQSAGQPGCKPCWARREDRPTQGAPRPEGCQEAGAGRVAATVAGLPLGATCPLPWGSCQVGCCTGWDWQQDMVAGDPSTALLMA